MKKKKVIKKKKKEKRPGPGHPTDYTETTCDESREYLASCVDKRGLVQLPTAEGLAKWLGVSRKTLYNWAEEHDQFLHILEQLNQNQVIALISNGLSGKYNSTIAKLVLAKHGYKDQVGLSGEGDGSPIKVDGNITATIDKIYGASSTVIPKGTST